MPTATPTMPASLIGVSKQRSLPKRCCRPCVQRNTPPKWPTSSPNTTTRSSRSMAMAWASRIASIIVIAGISRPPGRVVHAGGAAASRTRRRTSSLGLEIAPPFTDPCESASSNATLTCSVISAVNASCRSSSHSPIAIRWRTNRSMGSPSGNDAPSSRAVPRRVVGGGVGADAQRDPLDHRRAEVGAGPLGGPLRHGVHREVVVAVDAQRRDAEAESTVGERRRRAAGEVLGRGDRPVVVDDVEDHRRLVGGGEDERGVEVGLGGRSLADPRRGDRRVATQRRRHRPADRLDVLRGEVARDGEEPVLLGRVHHRELASLERVERVRQDLVHHVDDRIAGGDEQTLLAIRREVHVAGAQGVLLGAGDRLLAEALHVERDLALPMGPEHAGVERPHEHHVVQPGDELFRAEFRRPRPVGLVVLTEHLDELLAHQRDALDLLVERRLADLDGGVEVTAHPFGRVPAAGRLGDPEPEHRLGAGCVVGLHVENLPVATAAVKWYRDICANGRCDGRAISVRRVDYADRSIRG